MTPKEPTPEQLEDDKDDEDPEADTAEVRYPTGPRGVPQVE
jgi:hypothetical protein